MKLRFFNRPLLACLTLLALGSIATAQTFQTQRFGNVIIQGTVTMPDDSLEIADTSGLQDSLDGKASLFGSYADPAWITSLHWSKVTSKPTTLTGYGITDAVPATRTITASTGLTGGGDLSANRTLALTGQALALHNLGTNGLVARTGSGTVAARTLTGTAPITVTNGDGVAGNPTVAVSAATTSTAGVVQLATSAEVIAGTDTAKAVTAATLAAINPRGPPDWLWSDGVTSNRAQIQIPGPRGNIAGAPLASWVGWVDVPASNPSIYAAIFAMAPSGTPNGNQAGELSAIINTSGSLEICQYHSTFGNRRGVRYTGFRAAFSGRRVWMEIRFFTGIVAPVVRADGVDISSSFAAYSAGTQPDWLDGTLVATFATTGFNWPAGPAPLGCWINAHLTDAESEAWRITGRPPVWVALGGNQVPLVQSDFSAGIDGFGNDGFGSYPLTGNVDGIAGEDDWFSVSRVPTTQGGLYACKLHNAGLGRRIYMSVRVHLAADWVVSGATTVRISAEGASFVDATITPGQTIDVAGFFVTDSINGNGRIRVELRGGGSGIVYFKNIRAVAVGALSLPDILPISALGDGTLLGDNPARLVGVRPITARKDWQITVRTATSGNEQVLGGVFLSDSRDVFEFMEQTPETGTPTTAIGHVSGGTLYKTTGALTSGVNAVTLAQRRIGSGSAVWINSSTADPIRTTITGHSR